MIATDPLSLLFIGSFLFGLVFLVFTTILGNLGGHGGHAGVGHHAGNVPHVHVHIGHTSSASSHAGTHQTGGLQGQGVAIGHNATHASVQHTAASSKTAAASPVSPLLGYVNPTSIVLFLMGFGFFGYLFHNGTSLAFPLALILAIISGIIVAGLLLALLGRLFGDSEGETIQDVSDRTGLLAKVSVTIQEQKLGEVLYISPGGMRKSVPARSIDGRRIEHGQEVVVVNYQGGVAEVDTWEHFVNQEEHVEDDSTTPETDELAKLRTLLDETETVDTKLVIRNDMQKE